MYLDYVLFWPDDGCVAAETCCLDDNYRVFIQGVELKSGPYFNMSNIFTKIYKMLCYTTNLYLQ